MCYLQQYLFLSIQYFATLTSCVQGICIYLLMYAISCELMNISFVAGFLASFKLPSYEEVVAQPSTPPPPYSSVFALHGAAMGSPSSSYPHHPCPPYCSPGPSGLNSSQSSENYTTCSCESCSLTSPSSTSFSVQVTDETYDSSRVSTPSEAAGNCAVMPKVGAHSPPSQVPPDVIPAVTPDVTPMQRQSSNGSERVSPLAPPLSLPSHSGLSYHARLPLSPLMLLSSLPPGQAHPLVLSDPLGAVLTKKEREEGPSPLTTRPILSNPKQALFSSNLSVFTKCTNKEEQKRDKEEDEEEDGDDEEDHFRHRRLTADSGIEVCRCRMKREGEVELQKGHFGKERSDVLHDSMDCSRQEVQSPFLDEHGEKFGHIFSSSSFIQKTGDTVITTKAS